MKHSIIILLVVTAIVMTSCNNSTGSSHDEKGPYQFGIYDIEDSTLTIIKDFGTIEESVRPQFALYRPDGNRIVYYMRKCLYAIDIDGRNEMKISGDLDVDEDFPFATQDYVYFAAYNGECLDIFRTPWDESAPENVTNTLDIDEYNPFLNEDGMEMLYISRSDTIHSIIEQSTGIEDADRDVVYENHEYELEYPAYSPIEGDILFFKEGPLVKYRSASDDTVVIMWNSTPDYTGQLTFNTAMTLTACTSVYLNLVNYSNNETAVATREIYAVQFPSVSTTSAKIVFSNHLNLTYLFDIISQTFKEIAHGYYPRFSPDGNFILVFIH